MARKLEGIPLLPPDPPGSGMPQRKISRSFPSTFLARSTSSKSQPFFDSCRSDEPPFPNSFRTRQMRCGSVSKVKSTTGSRPPVHPTNGSQDVDACGSNNANRIASTRLDFPRSLGPYKTLSPGPNSMSTSLTAAKYLTCRRWSFIIRAHWTHSCSAIAYKDAPTLASPWIFQVRPLPRR